MHIQEDGIGIGKSWILRRKKLSAVELHCRPKKPLQLINESKVSQATFTALQYCG